MKHLIKTTAIFCLDEDSLSDIITEGDFRFILEDVSAYNESSHEGCTTIRFNNGFDIIVKIPMTKIDELMGVCLGVTALNF